MKVSKVRSLIRKCGKEPKSFKPEHFEHQLPPSVFRNPEIQQYLTRCLTWGDGIKLPGGLLLGTDGLLSYNWYSHPGAKLLKLGFLSIATTGRGSAKSVERDNVVCVDIKTGTVCFAEHRLFGRDSIKLPGARTGKNAGGYTYARVLKVLKPVAGTLEEFVVGMLDGSLTGKLAALEKATGTVDARGVRSCTPEPRTDPAMHKLLYPFIKDRKLSAAVRLCEKKLESHPRTPFHEIIGSDFLGNSSAFGKWMTSLLKKKTKSGEPWAALYCEMNEFEINTDRWYVDGFLYKRFGGTVDLDRLSDWDEDSGSRSFTLRGLDKIRKAYDSLCYEHEKETYNEASSITMYLVLLRFMELFEQTCRVVRSENPQLREIPMLCTVHAWDLIYTAR